MKSHNSKKEKAIFQRERTQTASRYDNCFFFWKLSRRLDCMATFFFLLNNFKGILLFKEIALKLVIDGIIYILELQAFGDV